MAEQHDEPPRSGSGLRRLWPRGRHTAAPVTEPLTSSLVALGTDQHPRPAGGADAPVHAISSAALVTLFAGAETPPALLAAFANGVAGLHGELAVMGRRLQSASDSADWTGYGRAMRQLIDKYIRTIADEPPLAEVGPSDAERLRDLLRHTLVMALETMLRKSPKLTDESQALGDAFKLWRPGDDLAPLAKQLKDLCHQVGLHAQGAEEEQAMLLGLFDLLLHNVAELLDDGSWLQAQIAAIRELLAGTLDRASLDRARSGLREVVYKQGLLKQGIAESKEAMKEMMVTFVERMDGMAVSTGEFHDRISYHAHAIRNARSIAGLGKQMDEMLKDTAQVQEQALRARDKLLAARQQVDAAEQRILQLEQELRDATSLVRVDQLTMALNRRGFDELFERESTRAERSGQPLCVALLDLDDFRQLNASHGHPGGDIALRHVVDVIRGTLRNSDAVARFGGEEFVLLLPDTSLGQSHATLQRIQQRLAQRPFLHEDQRVFVTFSAGVARWRRPETQDEVVRRADRAMYRAKTTGKNRVMVADD
jgi:diguanylate cyclase